MSSIGGPSGPPGGPRAPQPVEGGVDRLASRPDARDTGVGALGRRLEGLGPEGLGSTAAGRFTDFTIGLGAATRTPAPDTGLGRDLRAFTGGLPDDVGALSRTLDETRTARRAGIVLEQAVTRGEVSLSPGDPDASMRSVRHFADGLPEGLRDAVVAKALERLGR